MIETEQARRQGGFARGRWRATLLGRVGIAALVCAALALTLFPFDWLANVWPAYRALFDQVFASAASHHIGHTVLFMLVGLALLFIVPALRTHLGWYAALVVCGALAQEAIQALAKQEWPNWGDARDIGFDLLGLGLAFALMALWGWLRGRTARGGPVAAGAGDEG